MSYNCDETASYITKVFFVRYAEEQIAIRDFVKLRTEIDVARGYLATEFFLRVELHYSAPPQQNLQQAL